MKDGAEQTSPLFRAWVAARRPFKVDSPFFAAGNVERELVAKQISLEITEEEKKHIVQSEEEQLWEIFCPIVGCRTKLKGVGELESHYLSRHSATCSICTRVFPTTRLLNLHVSETHDSFFRAKVALNYPMYECLMEGCSARFLSDSNRHQHLVDKHHFPRSFRFHVKKHASQKQRQRQKAHQPSNSGSTPKQSKKNQRAKAASESAPDVHTDRKDYESTTPSETQNQDTPMDVDELVTAVSRLSTVSQDETPSVLRFGHRRGRGVPFGQKSRGSGRGRGRGRSGRDQEDDSPPLQSIST